MMKRYQVSICRTAYAFHTFEIVASSQKEAEREALDKAGDIVYSEKDAEYSVADIDKGTPVVTCSLCNKPCNAKLAHLHQGSWIGDECCWTEQLRSSE
jgi:hypothetical protein